MSAINEKIDNLREDLIKATQEIVRIKSVEEEHTDKYPYGEGPAKALECALNISKELGFKTVNLDNYIGYAEYGEGDEYVGILGHLDVVPEGEDWKYPPYAAEIHDGKMFGRGTLDDKAPTMATLFGLKAIKDAGLKLNKKVRIIFGTNEETGSREVEYYLNKEKPPVAGFTPDAEYPIINGEKGITIFDLVKDFSKKQTGNIIIKSIKGGTASNAVPSKCRAELEVEDKEAIIKAAEKFKNETGLNVVAEIENDKVIVKSEGVAAHGSLPQLGKNAIMQLFKFIASLKLPSSDAIDFINFMDKNVGLECHGETFGVCLEDEASGKLSFNVGVIDMNEDKGVMTLNLRYPVTKTYDDMMTPFNKKIENTGLKIENMEHQEPLYFSPDTPLIKKLQKVYKEQTGKEAELLSIGGGTYAKEMPNIVAFGPIFPGDPDLDHQTNEYIEVEKLILNAKIYAHAIYELAK